MTTVGLIRPHLHERIEQILFLKFQDFIILHSIKIPICVVFDHQHANQILHYLQFSITTSSHLLNLIYSYWLLE